MTALATPDDVARLFEREGRYGFARWGRPIVPVVFGVEAQSLGVIKGAIEAVATLAGHRMADTDVELGANLMVFFCRDWDELAGVPNLDRLVEGLPDLLGRLQAQGANQYRMFRLDAAGSIRAAFVFLRMDAALAEVPAEVLALDQAVRVILLWGEAALAQGVLTQVEGRAVLRPDLAAVIRAAYDPVLPDAAQDPSHALRLFARAMRGAG
jgi:hypothetical protein